jgi:tRNA-specific 2-thiouridylase
MWAARKNPYLSLLLIFHKNIVYTGQGKEHPGLFRNALKVNSSEIHWIRPDKIMKTGEERAYQVRIRYRQPLQKAKVFQKEDGLYIHFDNPQRGIAPGQFAAWYDEGELLGSGVIA